MIRRTASLVGALVALGACASYPAPVQRLADAEASSRSAAEVGVADSPQAQLHLTMAQEEIGRAKRFMNDGDNKRADYMLLRARGDAELALASAREAQAEAAASRALQQVSTMQSQTTSTTTTTSASPNANMGGKP